MNGDRAQVAAEFRIDDGPGAEGTHVVAVTGEIDLFTAPEFRQRVSAPIDGGCSRMVIDLSEVTFVDSSSLGVLIGAHKRLRERKGGLVIVCRDRAILNSFKITGLDSVFEVLEDRPPDAEPPAS